MEELFNSLRFLGRRFGCCRKGSPYSELGFPNSAVPIHIFLLNEKDMDIVFNEREEIDD